MEPINPQEHRLSKILQEKEVEYGPYSRSLNKIAAAWNILLKDQLRLAIEPWQIALMYAQAKLIRISHKFKSDSYDDAELYLLMAKELQQPIPTNEDWITGYKKWKKKKS